MSYYNNIANTPTDPTEPVFGNNLSANTGGNENPLGYAYGNQFTNPSQFSDPMQFLKQRFNIGFEGLDDISAFLPDSSVLQTAYDRMTEDMGFQTDKYNLETQNIRQNLGSNVENMQMQNQQALARSTGGMGLSSVGGGFGGKQRMVGNMLGTTNQNYQQQLGQNLTNYQSGMAGADLNYQKAMTGLERGYEDTMTDYKSDIIDRIIRMMSSGIVDKDKVNMIGDWQKHQSNRHNRQWNMSTSGIPFGSDYWNSDDV